MLDISAVLLELGLSSTVTDEERAVVAGSIFRAEAAVKRFLHYDPAYGTRTEYYPRVGRAVASQDTVWEVSGDQAVLRQLEEAASNELQLQSIPLRSITSLCIDYSGRSGSASGAFAAETLKVEGVDYWPNYDSVDSLGNKMCNDGVIKSSGAWPSTPGTVKVVYISGYRTEELHGQDSVVDASPILEAVLYEAVRRVRRMFANKKRTGAGFAAGTIVSESLGDYSYSVDGASASQLAGGGDLTPDNRERLQPYVLMSWE